MMATRWRTLLNDTRRTLSAEWALTSVEVGLVAGALAGLAMPVSAMLVALATGRPVWAPPEAITQMFFGELHAGADVALSIIIAGSVAHLLLSALFGAMYVLLLGVSGRAQRPWTLPVTGMAWGLGRWASNTFLIAPRLAGGARMTVAMSAWTWAAGHLLYGALLGLLVARWRHYIALETAD